MLKRKITMNDYVSKFMNKLTESSILINTKIVHPDIDRKITQDYDKIKNGIEISAKEMNILVLVQKNVGLTMTDVVKELSVKKPNATRFINRMVKKNLVRRCSSENGDKRFVYLELTDFATNILNERNRVTHTYMTKQIEAHTDENERREILDAFDSITKILSKFD